MTLHLESSTLGPLAVVLRPLSGEDERRLAGSGLSAAAALVKRLLDDARPGTLRAADLDAISVADFDRILAALHRSLYGARLDCRITCAACGEPLEFSLALDDLATRPGAIEVAPMVDRPGWFHTADGLTFRLPTLGRLIGGISHERLVEDCLPEGATADAAALSAAFAEAGPLTSDTVQSRCPSCSAAQTARVDLAEYLVAMLERERAFLLREVHVLARAYGWALGDILSLPRDDRRGLVRLVDAEAAARARWARSVA